jgi:small conductance mechanosensitive channel
VLEQLAAVPEWLHQVAELLRLDVGELTRKLLSVAGIWVFCYLAMRVVRLVARRIEHAVDDGDDSVMSEREQRGHTVAQLLRSVGLAVLISLGILLSLNVFINIGPLLAGAGILGLAVSFGAQSLVKDVITGFFYLLEGQFAVGDIIEVAGKSGVVERMTLRLVVLRDLHGVVHMIPNGQITTVSNQTRTWSRAVVDVGVAYGTDVDRALEVFQDEAVRFTEDPAWASHFDGPPEVLGVNELADSAVTIRVLLRTTPGKQFAVGREFRRRIKSRLDRVQPPARSAAPSTPHADDDE